MFCLKQVIESMIGGKTLPSFTIKGGNAVPSWPALACAPRGSDIASRDEALVNLLDKHRRHLP